VNVKQAVPFFGVVDMESSLRFYVDGLGFKVKRHWIPENDGHYPSEGKIRWCWRELGDAAIMLQEFSSQSRPKEALGIGVSVCFQCEDALALYRDFKGRGISTRQRPFVGNHLWVVALTDPDGYRIDFESPTDAPEESELEEADRYPQTPFPFAIHFDAQSPCRSNGHVDCRKSSAFGT
jgi:lactoylglutathione lyase